MHGNPHLCPKNWDFELNPQKSYDDLFNIFQESRQGKPHGIIKVLRRVVRAPSVMRECENFKKDGS